MAVFDSRIDGVTLMTKDRSLILMAVGLIILGLFLIFTGLSLTGFWKEAFVAVGQATLGSGLIGLAIDRAARESFIKETIRDAFGYIVGNHLPFGLRSKIDEIIHLGVVNEEFSQRYVITRKNKNTVSVLVEVSWIVRNYSLERSPHCTQLAILTSERPEFRQLVCTSENKEIIHSQINAEELKALLEQQGDKIIATSEQQYLQPRGKDGSSRFIMWKYEITKSIEDSDILSFGATTTGVSIVAEYNQEIFQVELESMHKFKKLFDHQWLFDRSQVFFKEQHIRLRWWPKSV